MKLPLHSFATGDNKENDAWAESPSKDCHSELRKEGVGLLDRME